MVHIRTKGKASAISSAIAPYIPCTFALIFLTVLLARVQNVSARKSQKSLQLTCTRLGDHRNGLRSCSMQVLEGDAACLPEIHCKGRVRASGLPRRALGHGEDLVTACRILPCMHEGNECHTSPRLVAVRSMISFVSPAYP